MTVILGTVRQGNMPRLSLLATLANMATLSSLNILANLANLANLVNLASLTTLSTLAILVSLATTLVVGLKIEASTESFTNGFAEIPDGDLLVAEGWLKIVFL